MTYDHNHPGYVVVRDFIDGMVTRTFELKQKTQLRNLCEPNTRAYTLGKVPIKKMKTLEKCSLIYQQDMRTYTRNYQLTYFK